MPCRRARRCGRDGSSVGLPLARVLARVLGAHTALVVVLCEWVVSGECADAGGLLSLVGCAAVAGAGNCGVISVGEGGGRGAWPTVAGAVPSVGLPPTPGETR